MGLNTISQLVEKRGMAYMDQFLSGKVTISEKIDTYRILFENINGEIRFFKKDNTEIGLIERVLTNVWEDAIIELSIILSNHSIPEGMRFGIAYTPIERPIRLKYSSIPKYILTDVAEKKEGKYKKVLEYEETFKWAEELGIGRAPVIFEGELTEKQKKLLINYGTGNWEDINEDNFSETIKNVFGKSYSNEEIIEGVIIKNKDQISQIFSSEFELLNEAYQKTENIRDFYDLTILNLTSFMGNYNFPIMEGETPDELYLNIICNIFNDYCKNSLVTEGLKPEYLTPPNFGYMGKLNILLIKNIETLDIIEKGGKIYESLFKVMLSSFRKYKKELGILNEEDVNKFNTIVYLISEKIGTPLESYNRTTEALNESRSDNIVIDAVNSKLSSDIGSMRVIASIQKAFEPKGAEQEKGKTPCVVYFSEFQPLTQSHVDNILSINKVWQCPIILASLVNHRRMQGDKFLFSDELIKAQIKSFADSNKELVPAYFVTENWSISDIFGFCRPNYEPKALITDIGKKSDFVLQLYLEEEVMGGRLGVEKDFNIGEMENKDVLQSFRTIENGSFYHFKELTPSSIWSFYDMMISEYKSWGGKILLK